MTTDIEKEEQMCSCGAGHGSREGHTDWCDWVAHVTEREHNDTCPYALAPCPLHVRMGGQIHGGTAMTTQDAKEAAERKHADFVNEAIDEARELLDGKAACNVEIWDTTLRLVLGEVDRLRTLLSARQGEDGSDLVERLRAEAADWQKYTDCPLGDLLAEAAGEIESLRELVPAPPPSPSGEGDAEKQKEPPA